ncbi:MAG: glycosyltransferase family 2 protein [Verrucomicrobia bacterium]|nr:glycosyltransferase family 2 protein [Verrucomicrobiota bacterium]
MVEISILVPTRGRPVRLLDFLQSIIDTTANLSDVEVVLAIDVDDRSYDEMKWPDANLKIVRSIAPQASMGSLNTRCLDNSSGKLIILGNDDVVFRTKGWDQIIVEESKRYPDGIFLMFAKDGIKNDAFPCFPILSRECCSLIEDPFPKIYKGDGIDSHLFDIFLRLKDFGYDRFCYLSNVYMEHRHISNGKGDKDAIYNLRSHQLGNNNFYTLWKMREDTVQKILCFFRKEKVSKLGLADLYGEQRNSILLIWSCFLQSKQSFSYRWKYLFYHMAREIYFCFQLHKVKRFAIRMKNRIQFSIAGVD